MPEVQQVGLDQGRELEHPQAIGDAAPIAPDALGKLLLGPPELREQPLVGLGLFHRIQIFAEQVFDQRQFQALGVGRFPDNGGNAGQAGQLGSAPAPLADDELVALADAPDDHRLQNACLLKRCREVS